MAFRFLRRMRENLTWRRAHAFRIAAAATAPQTLRNSLN